MTGRRDVTAGSGKPLFGVLLNQLTQMFLVLWPLSSDIWTNISDIWHNCHYIWPKFTEIWWYLAYLGVFGTKLKRWHLPDQPSTACCGTASTSLPVNHLHFRGWWEFSQQKKKKTGCKVNPVSQIIYFFRIYLVMEALKLISAALILLSYLALGIKSVNGQRTGWDNLLPAYRQFRQKFTDALVESTHSRSYNRLLKSLGVSIWQFDSTLFSAELWHWALMGNEHSGRQKEINV